MTNRIFCVPQPHWQFSNSHLVKLLFLPSGLMACFRYSFMQRGESHPVSTYLHMYLRVWWGRRLILKYVYPRPCWLGCTTQMCFDSDIWIVFVHTYFSGFDHMPGFSMLFSPVLTLAMFLFYFSQLLLGPPSELGFTVVYSSSYLSQWLLQVKHTIQIQSV